MEYIIGVGVLVCIFLQIYIIMQMRKKQDGGTGSIEALLKKTQQEEQKLRKEQSEHTNESIKLSMQMLNDTLSQSQSQTRETTATQLKHFEERVQGLEQANSRALSDLRDAVSSGLDTVRTQNDKRLGEIRQTVDTTLHEQSERTSESIQLSMQMLNDTLSQNQSQTRETTATQLKHFEERVQGLEQANSRALSDLRDAVSSGLDTVRTQNDKHLGEIRQTVDTTLHEQSERTSESIRRSMQVLSETLSQNQSQTRETTATQLKQFEERVKSLEQANSRALSELRETVAHELDTMRTQNDKQLAEIRHTVDTTLHEQLETRMNESFKRVTDSLERVYQGLGEMKTLAADVGGLKRVLSNVKQRGILGEIQLGTILQEILAPEQYAENVETVPGSGKRVEFAVKLPTEDGSPVWLPIDSKFPADCYTQLLDAQDSGDKEAIAAAQTELRRRILAFAKDIHDKYIREPETTAFGILFLPFEGLYSEVVRSGMTEELQRKYSINVAGPSTMAALLNALAMGFRTLAIQKQSDQVWKILGNVKTEFENFERVLDGTKKKLDAAGTELDKLVGVRTRAINKQLAGVQRLDFKPE